MPPRSDLGGVVYIVRGPRNRSISKGKPGSGAVDEFITGSRGLSSLSTKDLGDFGEILGVSVP